MQIQSGRTVPLTYMNDYGAKESCNFRIIVGKDLSQLHILSKIEYKNKIKARPIIKNKFNKFVKIWFSNFLTDIQSAVSMYRYNKHN